MRSKLAAALVVFFSSCGGTPCGTADPPPSERSEPAGETAPSASLRTNGEASGEKVTCPVCGLEFRAEETSATRAHDGVVYHFLLVDHAEAFEADPSAYLGD